MNESVAQMLRVHDICPVLMDVGASGHPPAIWQSIAEQSVYVGFDPDQREMRDEAKGLYKRSVMVNKVVTADAQCTEVHFYYTRSPFCSSSLRPDHKALGDYLFADLFEVENEGPMAAVTLAAVCRQLQLAGVDWLKVDSQGTDLRIFNSLPDAVRHGVLAVDIEPGLIDAYVGEDMFTEVHRELVRQGFWLSNMEVLGSIRIGRDSLQAVSSHYPDMTPACIEQTIRKSPGWCEARYLRTTDSLAQHDAGQRDYVLLWVFALLDKQYGYAIDLGVRYVKVFGKDNSSQQMISQPVAALRRISRQVRDQTLRARLKTYPINLLRRAARRVRAACLASF